MTDSNAITIATTTQTVALETVKRVQITSLRNAPEGQRFYAELHDERGTIRPVISATFNTDKPLKAWDADENVTVAIMGRGMVVFGCHTMGGPKYPVAKIAVKRETPRNVRVTFYTDIEPAQNEQPTNTEKALDIIDVDSVNVSTVPMLEAPVPQKTIADFPKLNRADFESQGAFLQACKKRKADMREAGVAE